MSHENESPPGHGDVYQIVDRDPGRSGWYGALVLATESRNWGIIGFLHHVISHTECGQVHVRLKWEQVEFVGEAPLQPTP